MGHIGTGLAATRKLYNGSLRMHSIPLRHCHLSAYLVLLHFVVLGAFRSPASFVMPRPCSSITHHHALTDVSLGGSPRLSTPPAVMTPRCAQRISSLRKEIMSQLGNQCQRRSTYCRASTSTLSWSCKVQLRNSFVMLGWKPSETIPSLLEYAVTCRG
jgi:hypothetical protein